MSGTLTATAPRCCRTGALALALVLGALPRLVQAQPPEPCAARYPRWVAVAFVGEGWSAPLEAAVFDQLAAGFDGLGLAVCADGQRTEPAIARVLLTAPDSTLVEVAAEVDDQVTRKRVGRSISVAQLDDQGKALAIAIGTEELVRASWAELALTRTRTQAEPQAVPEPPVEVTRAVAQTVRPELRRARRASLVAELAASQYTQGFTLFGVDGVVREQLASFVALELGGGYRRAFPRSVRQGSLQASAASGRLDVVVGERPDSGLGLAWVVGVQVQELAMRGEPAGPGYVGTSVAATSVTTHTGLLTTLLVTERLELVVRLGGGYPVLAAPILVDGERRGGIAGAEISGGLGLGVRP